ncbi:efflux RND transporter periplasmic adaptor subunit [Trichlorobacter sp.]|uniref:efflux RND transporter periplasmic adaptor subunit n=1 Tax=Trichlorobacter sp. TaxID=2911007 RepID=UPI002A36C509|nr:efflux RND transporter periplasmic adaptor subunit [Trichlorobacter sp.]MDY0383800.1 efflux RND transporter periplasmic adaptor subunit [Trichlorobacter sp.]
MTRLPLLLRLPALGALLIALGACSNTHDQPPASQQVLKDVPVVTVTSSELAQTVELSGIVRARTSALVAARIPGTVSLLQVREGDRVRKGQLLARLEAQEQLAQAGAANAGIEEAQRGLDEALAQRTLADATLSRFQVLYDEQALTRQEFETRQTECALAHQRVARAEARLRQARENARAAGAMADYARITAPISGIITSKQVDLGVTVFPGQPLMTIDDETSYQLELVVPESYAALVRPGTPVQVSLDALQKTVNATVAELVPAADPASRTFTAKVNLRVSGLKSGLFGRAILALDTTRTTLLVPKQAIFERGALTAVWTVDQTDTIRMRLVKVGKAAGGQVEILAGLTGGERIVATHRTTLVDGAKLVP